MKTDELKQLGIEDENLIKQIHALAGKDIEKYKTDMEAMKAEIDGYKAQVEEAAAQIAAFKEMDIEGVKAAADDWKAKAEQAQAEAQKQIESLKFEHALSAALSEAKAKNTRAVKALLDHNELKLTEAGEILGLKEQLALIKNDNDFLFEPEKPEPRIIAASKNEGVIADSVVDAARRAAGLK